jgi:hypothetical protein
MEQLVQFPVSVFVRNPHLYFQGAMNYSFGVGPYISKQTKQFYNSEADFSIPEQFVSQTNYFKAGFCLIPQCYSMQPRRPPLI